MTEHYRNLITTEFEKCVSNTIARMSSGEQTNRPFHVALLPADAVFWSRFERSFSTSFGQRVLEEIARLVVLSNGAEQAQRQRSTIINIDEAYEHAISYHIQALRNNDDISFDWDSSLASIKSVQPSGKMVSRRIISDLWWRKDDIDHFLSLKTVKPNIDQAAVAKEDCLRLSVGVPRCKAFFGLPYNPYGELKSDYKWTPPMHIFDFHDDSVVLIGKELWDTLGGAGCFDELLSIAREVGKRTKTQIDNIR